ncbi:LysE family translocator [Pseudomonas peradeniyensis]|uniref:LysE family translocator n=1 Tax=Pseudomonas peradeniyensis TaxID=2745488 RepID=UPI00311B03F2
MIALGVSATGIALAPGPNTLIVLTHGALHGSRKTLFTITGGVIGFVWMIALCVLGLGVLLMKCVFWQTALKIVGGIYLSWLGVYLWRSEPVANSLETMPKLSNWSVFRQGLLSSISNPNALLLFTA